MCPFLWLRPHFQVLAMLTPQNIGIEPTFWGKFQNVGTFWPKWPLKMDRAQERGFEAWAAHLRPNQIWVPCDPSNLIFITLFKNVMHCRDRSTLLKFFFLLGGGGALPFIDICHVLVNSPLYLHGFVTEFTPFSKLNIPFCFFCQNFLAKS